jgi:N-acetylglutamate synthase
VERLPLTSAPGSGGRVNVGGETGVVADARGLQEMAARALPADYVEYVGDWWLRYSPGSSWWVGTALPHGTASEEELRKRIFAAERFYDRFGSVTRFQVTPGVCPDRLDSMLAEKGYRRESLVSLRTASTAEVQRIRRRTEFSLRWDPNPTPEWFGLWHALYDDGIDPLVEWNMLGRVRQPSAYASAWDGGKIISVARAVIDGDWAGIFSMATVPEARGMGAGRTVLSLLADWAAAHAAAGMYLQVEIDNDPALRLYNTSNFTELRRYHYRQRVSP